MGFILRVGKGIHSRADVTPCSPITGPLDLSHSSPLPYAFGIHRVIEVRDFGTLQVESYERVVVTERLLMK